MSDSEKQGGPHGDALPGESLSEADRARIRAEEAYRQEVRAQLSGTPPAADNTTANRRPLTSLLILIPVVLLGFFACDSLLLPGVLNVGGGQHLTYAVSSTCPVDVTYTVGRVTQQERAVTDGWTRTVQSTDLPHVLIGRLQCDGTVKVTISGGRTGTRSTLSTGAHPSVRVTYP